MSIRWTRKEYEQAKRFKIRRACREWARLAVPADCRQPERKYQQRKMLLESGQEEIGGAVSKTILHHEIGCRNKPIHSCAIADPAKTIAVRNPAAARADNSAVTGPCTAE